MKVARMVIPVVILVALVTGYLVMAAKEDDSPPPLDDKRATEVVVQRVARHDGTVDIHVDGQVVPYREIDLSAEVAGRITYKADEARAGRFVKKGIELFHIDDRDYTLEVERLEKQLEQAGVAIQELDEEMAGAERLVKLAKDQVDLAQDEYDRQAELYRRSVAAKSELDKAQRDVIAAENARTTVNNQYLLLKTRRSRLEQAKELLSLQIKKAENNLARTKITVPVHEGVIVRDSVEQDDFVNVGTPMVTIEDTSAVEVKCNLQMDELYWIWDQAGGPTADISQAGTGGDYHIRRTPAKIRYRLQEQDYLWKGELWRIDGIGLDERTRTVPCRVIVEEPGLVYTKLEDGEELEASGGPPALVRGMYVDVEIEIRPKTELFRVPETAVKPGQKHETIWVARLKVGNQEEAGGGEKTAEWHELEAIDVDIVDIVVRADDVLGEMRMAIVHAAGDGLLEGDQVLVTPLGKLHNGMRVTPKGLDGSEMPGRRSPGQDAVDASKVAADGTTAPRNTSR